MKRLSLTVSCVMFVSMALYAASAFAGMGSEGHIAVTPADLKWADVPSLPPGAKVAVIEGPLNEAVPYTFRLKVPAGYIVPPHTHPVVERVTVIFGTFNLGFGDRFDPVKTKPYPAGSVIIMPPGMKMFAFAPEETVIQIHGTGPWGITYINPAEDPRKK